MRHRVVTKRGARPGVLPGPDGHVLTLPETVTVSQLIHEAVHLRQLELRPQDTLTDPERAEEVARRLTEELVARIDEEIRNGGTDNG